MSSQAYFLRVFIKKPGCPLTKKMSAAALVLGRRGSGKSRFAREVLAPEMCDNQFSTTFDHLSELTVIKAWCTEIIQRHHRPKCSNLVIFDEVNQDLFTDCHSPFTELLVHREQYGMSVVVVCQTLPDALFVGNSATSWFLQCFDRIYWPFVQSPPPLALTIYLGTRFVFPELKNHDLSVFGRVFLEIEPRKHVSYLKLKYNK